MMLRQSSPSPTPQPSACSTLVETATSESPAHQGGGAMRGAGATSVCKPHPSTPVCVVSPTPPLCDPLKLTKHHSVPAPFLF